MSLDPELLKILACPVCRAPLRESPDGRELACAGCARRYAVRDGIPDLVIGDASSQG